MAVRRWHDDWRVGEPCGAIVGVEARSRRDDVSGLGPSPWSLPSRDVRRVEPILTSDAERCEHERDHAQRSADCDGEAGCVPEECSGRRQPIRVLVATMRPGAHAATSFLVHPDAYRPSAPRESAITALTAVGGPELQVLILDGAPMQQLSPRGVVLLRNESVVRGQLPQPLQRSVMKDADCTRRALEDCRGFVDAQSREDPKPYHVGL